MRSKILILTLMVIMLPGCMFLSGSEVTALKDRVDILEKRAELNEHQRKLLEKAPGINPTVLTILDQNTTIIKQSATTVGNIVGRNPDE